MREIITYVCKCGIPVERRRETEQVSYFTCKKNRRTLASTNYYNLKRRKQYAK